MDDGRKYYFKFSSLRRLFSVTVYYLIEKFGEASF